MFKINPQLEKDLELFKNEAIVHAIQDAEKRKLDSSEFLKIDGIAMSILIDAYEKFEERLKKAYPSESHKSLLTSLQQQDFLSDALIKKITTILQGSKVL